MTKQNNKKVVLTALGLLLFVGWFYWYEVRPSKIRAECSWVAKHSDAKPAYTGKTEDELKLEGALMNCSNTSGTYRQYCESTNKVTIESWTPRSAEIERDVFVPATKTEYDFCIRSRGLIR